MRLLWHAYLNSITKFTLYYYYFLFRFLIFLSFLLFFFSFLFVFFLSSQDPFFSVSFFLLFVLFSFFSSLPNRSYLHISSCSIVINRPFIAVQTIIPFAKTLFSPLLHQINSFTIFSKSECIPVSADCGARESWSKL